MKQETGRQQPGIPFLQGGEDVKKAYSDDGGSAQSGRVYVIDRPGQFVPEFEAAAEELTEPGQVTEPVRSQFGYHLIELVSRQESYVADFASVRHNLVEAVRQDYITQVRETHRRQLTAQPEQGNEELLRSLPARYAAPAATVEGED